MKAALPALAALVGVLLGASLASAQPYYGCSPALQRPLGQAPDAFGPPIYTWYTVCTPYGPTYAVYGPGYNLYPPFPPFQGLAPGSQGGRSGPPGAPPAPPMPGMPPQAGQQPQVIFPVHPYARSPRDFYMWTEAQEERITRERALRNAP